MHDNVAVLQDIGLRRRILRGAGEPSLETEILGSKWSMPVAFGPVGPIGMYARRGEV
jgi:L-lactate dehydrogenase (cytochrome)